MIAMSPLQFSVSGATLAPAPPVTVASGFAVTLAAFLDLGMTAPNQPAEAMAEDAGREFAGNGKILPPGDRDERDAVTDEAMIWLPVSLPQPLPGTPAVPSNTAGPGTTAHTSAPPGGSHRADVIAPLPLDPAPPTIDPATVVAPAPIRAAAPTPAPAPAPALHLAIAAQASRPEGCGDVGIPVKRIDDLTRSTIAASPAEADFAQRVDRFAPKPAVSIPVTASAPPMVQPAAYAFAAAIAAASTLPGHRRTELHPNDPLSTSTIGTPIEVPLRPMVHGDAEVQQGALDLRDDRGLQHLIDRIESLRDDSDARDTRIRLVPDALGGVDVAVRRDGNAVHVHFTADRDATRILLHEAQPQLAELAQARGIRIVGASVEAGAGSESGTGQRWTAPSPAARQSAKPDVTSDTDPEDDGRLA